MKEKKIIQGELFPERTNVSSPQPPKPPSLKEQIELLKEKLREKEQEIADLQKEISKLMPKAAAFDDLIQSNSLFPIGVIAKNFGMSAVAMNAYLHDKKVQYKRGDIWMLYAPYQDKGYTRICYYHYDEDSKGRPLQRPHTYWTAKGLAFVRELLKKDGRIIE